MKNLIMLVLCIILMPLLNTSFAEAGVPSSIIFSDSGLIQLDLSTQQASSAKMMVMVQANGQEITYPLVRTKDTFPMQLGDGNYTVTLLKWLQGDEYLPLESWDHQLAGSNNRVYLQSIQNIKWSSSDDFVRYYDEVYKTSANTDAFVRRVHSDMVSRFSYDTSKFDTIVEPYVPDNRDLYASKLGICYDFASYFAAVMRAHDIPCKLVKGYRTGIVPYHAWNEVYLDGVWKVVDVSYDIDMKSLQLPPVLYQDSQNYTKVHEY